MAQDAPIYDLMILLATSLADEEKQKVLAAAEKLITADGEIVSKHDWGLRPTAFEIKHKGEAEYHLIQFKAGRDAIRELDRVLRITDGVTRFRIIKLRAGTPAPPDLRQPIVTEGEPAPADEAPTPA